MSSVIDLIDRRLPALQDLAERLERVKARLRAFNADAAAPSFRSAAESVVEAIIGLLDLVDPDDEVEAENEHGDGDGYRSVDEEPSLGATGGMNQIRAWRDGAKLSYLWVDLEQGDEREGDELDSLEGDSECDREIEDEGDDLCDDAGNQKEVGEMVDGDFRRRLFARRGQKQGEVVQPGFTNVTMLDVPLDGSPVIVPHIPTAERS